MTRRRPIPPVATTLQAIGETVDALRERSEVGARERGNKRDSYVTVQDLLDLGLITEAQADRL